MEVDDDDFGAGADAHGGSPCAGAGADDDVERAALFVAVEDVVV